MSILKVARMGHPVLRAKAQALERAEIRKPPVQQLIDDMIETMIEYHGVGLAAPQVHEGRPALRRGRSNTRDDDSDDRDIEPVAIINPEIIPVGSDIVEGWEGCLSIPDIRGRVPRAREIKVRGARSEGRRHSSFGSTIFRPAWFSTRPTISTASCFSIGCGRSSPSPTLTNTRGTGPRIKSTALIFGASADGRAASLTELLQSSRRRLATVTVTVFHKEPRLSSIVAVPAAVPLFKTELADLRRAGLVSHPGGRGVLFSFSWTNLFVAAVPLLGGRRPRASAWATTGCTRTAGSRPTELFEYFLAICGTLTLEGGPIFWVATHRLHHQHSDQPLDPHTPRVSGFWAHIGLDSLRRGAPQRHRAACRATRPTSAKDPFYRWLTTYHWVPLTVLGFALLAVGGWPLVNWAIFLRVVVGLHATWLVNSATHMWGRRRFATQGRLANSGGSRC